MRALSTIVFVCAVLCGACSDDSSSSDASGGSGGTQQGGTGGSGATAGGAASGGAGSAGTSAIPEDRMMDWSIAGVPGGIPSYDTICATVTDASQLQAAVDACPPKGVVYVPAGSYALPAAIKNANHHEVVVRGDGPGKTVFTVSSEPAFSFGNADWPPPEATVPIVAGATRNSDTITLDSTAGFQVGGLMRISAGINPPFVHNLGVASYDEQLSMTFRVTAVTDTSVSFEPRLPFDFSPYQPKTVALSIPPLTGVGLEDFTIDLQGSSAVGIEYQQMWGSWIENVEIKNAGGKVLTLYTVLHGEVRHCTLRDSINGGPDTEGLDFYRDVAWTLIEDNIVYNAGGIFIGDWQGGDVGNVIAYNFAYATSSGDPSVAGYDIDVNHGSNNLFNLIEGNIAGGVMSDGYFGSTSHDTLFRNWLTATHPTAQNNLASVKLKHFSNYFNVVGNVLGTSAFPSTGSVDGSGFAHGGFYDAPQSPSYDNGWSTGVQVIFELGFPNIGNTGYSGTVPASDPIDYSSQGASLAEAQALDLNVGATLLRHGNFDYVNQAIVWDPGVAQQELPQSLFRAAKPAFFGSLAWPPFDAASPPGAFNDENLARIPAGYRYLNGVDP